MLILSLLLFAAALVVLSVAASRGLSDIDRIVTIVDPSLPSPTSQAPDAE